VTGLLVDATALRSRAALARDAGAPFAPLAASLAADLDQVIAADVHVAGRKARLTRAGGRCPMHGVEFAFDPFSPHRFRCEACGRDYEGDAHHEFWLYRYQLWLAERAVHAAALYAVLGRPDHAAFAARVLAEAADVYPRLPNRDNVLGPTRPFFSTYLESLWLLSLCVALDLLESAGAAAGDVGGAVRDRLVAPSRALVASYPEGRSNRQVWNAAAGLAAARLLGDARGADEAVHGRDGIAACLRDGLLADGTWFEGDNYHQFAHRGLWFGLTLAARAGIAPDPALVDRTRRVRGPREVGLVPRFDRGFVTPFLAAMPGPVMPARRDSQFGVSLRQWRWAEWLELGLARPSVRREDARLLADWLGELYAPDAAPGGDTGRWRASGEAERNEPAVRLTRADLGWKSLLFARAEAPPARGADGADSADAARAGSVSLESQGLAVLRGGARAPTSRSTTARRSAATGTPTCSACSCRRTSSTPARARTSTARSTGTGAPSPTPPRSSTSARSRRRPDGRLLGFDAHAAPALQGVGARATIAPGVEACRWLVLTDDYLVDRLSWTGLGDAVLDLPIGGALVDARIVGAGEAAAAPLAWAPVHRPGGGGLEDGFDFLADVRRPRLTTPGVRLVLGARGLGASADPPLPAYLWAPPGATLWRATGARRARPAARPDHRRARERGRRGHRRRARPRRRVTGARSTRAGAIEIDLLDHRRTATSRPTRRGYGAWRVRRDRAGLRRSAVRLAIGLDRDPLDAPGHGCGSAALRGRRRGRAPGGDRSRRVPSLGATRSAAHTTRDRRSRGSRPAGRPPRSRSRCATTACTWTSRCGSAGPPPSCRPVRRTRSTTSAPRINGDGLQLHLAVGGPLEQEPAGAWLFVPVEPGTRRGRRPHLAAAPGVRRRGRAGHLGGRTRRVVDGRVRPARAPPVRLRRGGRGEPARGRQDAARRLARQREAARARAAARPARPSSTPAGRALGEEGAGFVYLRGDRYDARRGIRLRAAARALTPARCSSTRSASSSTSRRSP
jgi:hypothetical protein